jgi:hypothetical protein
MTPDGNECVVCGAESTSYWHPFVYQYGIPVATFSGADEQASAVEVEWPALPICDDCRGDVEHEMPTEFIWEGQRYIADWQAVYPVPDFVGDPLTWWEEGAAEE